jgi:hypothetical protein
MKSILTLMLALISTFATAQKSQGGSFNLDEDYKMSPTGTVKLTSSDAKVTITGSNRPTAHVKIDREVNTRGFVFGSEEFSVEVEERGGDLEIREKSRSSSVGMIGYHYERYTIELEVPLGVSLLVRGDDGDLLVRNVNGAISISLDDGDAELLGCKGDKFNFRVDDGDINMDEGAGTLEIDADDADVRILNGKFTRILADLDDGDLIIETSLDDRGEYSVRAEDGLIDFTILGGGGQFHIRHDDSRVITDSKFSQVEQSDDFTKVTLAKGSARIDIRTDDGRVRLAAR